MSCPKCKNNKIFWESYWRMIKPDGTKSDRIKYCPTCNFKLIKRHGEEDLFYYNKEITKKENISENIYKPRKTIADIIIPHHDRHDLLKNLLDKLPNDLFNIIIVSGGTFAENCNKGAKIAKTNNLIFMNDDIVPDIKSLVESFERNEDIVGFTENIDGNFNSGVGLREEKRDNFSPFIKKQNNIQLPLGFLFTIKKKVWKDLKGFDEKFKNGLEDIDLFLRAKKKGYTFSYIEKPIKHFCGASDGRLDYSEENKETFWSKWSEDKIKDILEIRNIYSQFFIKEPLEEKVDIAFIETIPGEADEAIKAVKENTKHPYKITVYDNTKEKSKNLTKTWNKLVKNSNCKYICLINTDAFVTEGWLTELMKGFQKENALLVTPSGDNVFGKQSTDILKENKFESLDYFSGFCFVVDKDKMKDIDYFDEEVSFYGNEKVFAVKVRKSKYLMLWAKGSFVEHRNESTVREMGLFDELREKGFKEKAEWYAKNSPVLFLTFNRLEFTKKAYKSLINSGVEHIIIIDNNSTDGTKEWIAKRKSKKIDKIILNDKNKEIAGAMTQFFEMTKGERYVGKVDNDTIVPENWFKDMIERCERYGVDISQPKHDIFSMSGQDYDSWVYGSGKEIAENMYKMNNIGGSAIVVRRDKLKDYNISTYKNKSKLSGWTEYQVRHKNLTKTIDENLRIELLDMNGDNNYNFSKYPEYYKEVGRLNDLKYRNLGEERIKELCNNV